jgi:hypothetical protein
VNLQPRKIRVNAFVQSITCGGDTLVCLTTRDIILVVRSEGTVEEVTPSFRWELVKTVKNQGVIAGEGNLLCVLPGGEIVGHRYPDRIGRPLDICSDGHGQFIVCGSSSAPIKVFTKPIETEACPSLEELKTVVFHYGRKFNLMQLFDKEPWHTFLLTLTGRFDDLASSPCLGSLVPVLNDLEPHMASEVFHWLVVHDELEGLSSRTWQSDFARMCFLKHGGDLKALRKEQHLSMLPEPMARGGNTVDRLPIQMMRKAARSIVVPSARFKEGKLFVFSCGHTLNGEEMLAKVSEIQKLCKRNDHPGTAAAILGGYLVQAIPVQCPKCLFQKLNCYFNPG